MFPRLQASLVIILAFSTAAAFAQCPLNPTQPSVTICSPAQSSTVSNPVHFVALTNSSTAVTSMDILVDTVVVYHVAASSIDTTMTLQTGARHILIRGKNTAGTTFWKSEDITVAGSTPPPDCTLSSTQPSVTICSPAKSSTVADPVQFIADTNSATPVTSMDVLVDGAVVYSVAANRVNTQLTLAPGTRHILIRGKNTAGTTFWKSEDITVTSNSPGLSQLGHIIWMFQENRSFDHYFGHINDYRTSIGLPADVDGTPANAVNYSTDGTTAVTPFHLATSCVEDLTPGWTESHRDFNLQTPTSDTPKMDGFVWSAAHMAQYSGFHDTLGQRAMGYYTSDDLLYYHFMASQFAMSDRWFSPVSTNSPDNRLYGFAATSQGYVHDPGQLTAKTIFEELENAGISWKVYYSDTDSTGHPATRMNNFWGFTQNHLDKIVPVSQYFTDLQNNTLPAVAFIEAGTMSGRDEHPGGSTTTSTTSGTRIQTGAAYVASIINALMQSSSWRTSAFILAYDEAGGFYDHVPPITGLPNPDGIPPKDLTSNDTVADFTRTGFRVPMMVISPFSKKNYVSHTPADHTAILKLIETRFGLPSLTKRDAAQMDMTEFFDFTNIPWMNPPNPPVQGTSLGCHNNYLP